MSKTQFNLSQESAEPVVKSKDKSKDKTTDKTTAKSKKASLLWLVFAVFAAGYFLSYSLRAVNAVLSPDLRSDMGLSAQAMGWLTSVYLIAFAAMQLPLGVLLDRYGARKVESALLLVAALGCVLFASASSSTGLFLGRALIGAGVSACLMAAFTSFRLWFDPQLMSRLAACMLVVGTSGALVASVPVRMLADANGWRTVFWIAAVAFVAVAVAMWVFLPKHQLATSLASTNTVSYRQIFRRQAIRAAGPLAFFGQGGFIALQTLWVAPWLTQNLNQSAQTAAQTLMWMNGTLVVAFALIGVFGGRLNLARERKLILGLQSLGAASLLGLAFWQAPQSWVLFIVLAISSTGAIMLQSRVSVSLPKDIAGRGNVAVNLLSFLGGFLLQGGIGWLASVLVQAAGASAAQGLAASFVVLALCQLASVAWLWAHWREPVEFDSAIKP